MRHAIETVPRDGKVVILEDDVSGSFELAHWSAEARTWVGENGELSKITPTYWHATRRDEHRLQKGDEYLQDCGGGSATQERHYSPFSSGLAPRRVAHAAPVMEAAVEPQTAPSDAERGPSVWRRFFVSSIAAAMVAASLLGMYFRAQIATYVTQYAGQQHAMRIGTVGARVVEQKTQLPSPEPQKSDSLPRDPARHHQAEADRASSRAAWWDAAQLQQAAEAMAPEAQQPLERERRRAEALASELATARRDTETQVALASETRDEAAQLKQAAESATAELRQSLQKGHDRTEALASELATARRDIETQVALSRKTSADTAEFKQTTESATAELRQSLQKEHDRAEALASELVMARRDIEAHVARAQRDLETQVALSSKRGGEEAVKVKQAAESATAELRQSLLNEQDRTEALARELARAQQDLKTQVALSRKTGGEGTQVEQAAESATAELRQSLQKEHDRAEALAGELARAQRDIDRQAAQSRSDQSRFVRKPRPRTLQIAGLPRSSLHRLRSARSSSMTFQLRERTRISAPANLISRFQKQNQVRRTDRPT